MADADTTAAAQGMGTPTTLPVLSHFIWGPAIGDRVSCDPLLNWHRWYINLRVAFLLVGSCSGPAHQQAAAGGGFSGGLGCVLGIRSLYSVKVGCMICRYIFDGLWVLIVYNRLLSLCDELQRASCFFFVNYVALCEVFCGGLGEDGPRL